MIASKHTLRAKRRWHMLVLSVIFLCLAIAGLSTLPVIDRDEARFAQASVQMAESGDLLNIRYQDEARNKKPAGIYWLQTMTIKMFSSEGDRKLWAQRIPSVIGALLALLATYWGGTKLIGREAAFIGSLALSLSVLLVFEAHIAKTDALLCGLAATCFAVLAIIRSRPPKDLSLWKADLEVWVFWIAFGLAVLVKGPVVPVLIALTLTTLLIWERRGNGIKQLVNIPAIVVSLLLFIPWTIAIGLATDGAFFADSLGNDLGGKLVTAQEKHSGLPGYHLSLIGLTLWPGSIFIIPGLILAFRTLKNDKKTPSPLAKSMRLCLAWIVPFWVLLELIPTKLPHYTLPLFPPLCLLIGLACLALLKGTDKRIARFIGGLVFILLATLIITALLTAKVRFGTEAAMMSTFLLALFGGIIAISAGIGMWFNQFKFALISGAVAAFTFNLLAYAFILPDLADLRLADRVEAALSEKGVALPRFNGSVIQAVNFTEPSLIYRLGKETRLGGQIDLNAEETWEEGRIFIVDILENQGEAFENFMTQSRDNKACLDTLSEIKGMNYSRGDYVNLNIMRVIACPDNFSLDETEEQTTTAEE